MMKRESTYESMSVFEQVQEGLRQSIAHAKGELTLRTTRLPAPAPKLSKKRVIQIRKRSGMSQGVMAAYLNVPKRTLESWEQGRRTPKASEARLLQIWESAPEELAAKVLALTSPPSKPKGRRSRRAA
jgi:putative transcriptional regulator